MNDKDIKQILGREVSFYLSSKGSLPVKVLITGSVNCYAKKGTYNILVNKMEEYGKGLIYQRFIL